MDFQWHWNINDFYNQNGYDTNTSFNKFSDILFGTNFSQNADNKKIAEQNIAWQQEANAQNIAFQKEENAITREREDNAVQRAAADMTAAGLSKTLAAGQPASAAALTAPRTQAVSNSMKYENAFAKMDLFQRMQDLVFRQKEFQMKEDLNDAQIANINASTVGQNNVNNTFMGTWTNEQVLKLAQADQAKSMARLNTANADLQEKLTPFKVEEVQKDIAYKIAQIDLANKNIELTDKNIEKIAQDIAVAVATENKLNKEVEYLVEQIVTETLKQAGWTHDLGYAGQNGLPVGAMPTGLAGGIVTAGQSLANMAYTGLVKPFFSGLGNLWNWGKGLFGFGD